MLIQHASPVCTELQGLSRHLQTCHCTRPQKQTKDIGWLSILEEKPQDTIKSNPRDMQVDMIQLACMQGPLLFAKPFGPLSVQKSAFPVMVLRYNQGVN